MKFFKLSSRTSWSAKTKLLKLFKYESFFFLQTPCPPPFGRLPWLLPYCCLLLARRGSGSFDRQRYVPRGCAGPSDPRRTYTITCTRRHVNGTPYGRVKRTAFIPRYRTAAQTRAAYWSHIHTRGTGAGRGWFVGAHERGISPPPSLFYIRRSRRFQAERDALARYFATISPVGDNPRNLQGIMVFPGMEEDDFGTKAGSILNYAQTLKCTFRKSFDFTAKSKF